MLANFAILLALSLAWASNYVFISEADKGLPPLTATAAIALAAAVFLFIGVRLGLRRPLWPILRDHPMVPLIMAVTALALPQLSSVAAEDSISPDLATVIGTTVPILTFLVGACILKTTPAGPLNFLGVAIAAAGIVIFADPVALLREPAEVTGIAIMMSGGVVFVANGLYAAHRTADMDQYALTVWIVVFAAAGLTVAALVVDGMPRAVPARDELQAIMLSGFAGTGVAYLFYYLLLARAGAAFTSLYAFLVPILGVFLTVVFLGHALTWSHGAGVCVVLIGLWLILHTGKSSPGHNS